MIILVTIINIILLKVTLNQAIVKHIGGVMVIVLFLRSVETRRWCNGYCAILEIGRNISVV